MRGGVLFVVVAAIGAFGQIANAGGALDKPAFAATPAELLAAAKTPPAGSSDGFLLREDEDISLDDKGLVTKRWHMIYVLTGSEQVDEWKNLGSNWHPDFQDKPTIRIRVIDPNGTATDADLTRMTEDTATSTSEPDAERRVEVPLPRLQVGSIIEQEVVTKDRVPLVGGVVLGYE